MSTNNRVLDPYGDLYELLCGEGSTALDPAHAAHVAHVGMIRKKLIWAYSWAVPTPEAIAEIARHSPLIEIGAGTGYWAWLVRQAGGDVLAFDRLAEVPPHWGEVLLGEQEKVTDHPDRTLFLCWPSLDQPIALECLQAYRGDVFLHIGELGAEARTGSASFREELAGHWRLEHELPIRQWPGYSDSLTIWRRKRQERLIPYQRRPQVRWRAKKVHDPYSRAEREERHRSLLLLGERWSLRPFLCGYACRIHRRGNTNCFGHG